MREVWLRHEGPTWLAIVLTYAIWMLATGPVAGWALWAGILLAVLPATLHESLTHELLHGHPTRWPLINALLALPAIALFIPYLRFRDTHMAHHHDEHLTDPYDDPESNYLDPAVWARLPGPLKGLLRLNNTLLGRMVLGPAISQVVFMVGDGRAILRGERRVLAGWLLHVPALAIVVWWARAYGQMPFWAYLVQAYLALSLLKVRTFLEHRADEDVAARTVLIEQPCPLAWLFLFNSLHIVHHSRPEMAWYRLPAHYRAHRAEFQALNHGYLMPSYAQVFRRYLFRAKDPVPHPLWPKP